MTATMRADSRTMYSWWWDSHICPKNSKWLHENLADMDAKVKQMIKLIEEDADSFAMRAEMYYKKRPELMKLVEEFYRAYRALAERYDHATVVIRQAHRTIAEAYPNQVPILLSDDSSETDAHLHQTTPPASTIFGLRGMDESFGYEETINQVHSLSSSEAEQVDKPEIEISSSFKPVLPELEGENDVVNLERLSNLESEVFQAQENFKFLNQQAIKAQGEVKALKESISKLETEREVILLQYQRCLENISTLERNISCVQKEYGELTDQACRTEIEVESLKEDIARVEAEKEAALVQCRLSSTRISNLENRLRHEIENAESYKEQADRAGIEVLTLKESLARYQECLEKIPSLEHQISVTQDEAQWLHSKIEEGVAKLKGAEEKCQLLERSNQALQSELGLTLQNMQLQSEELSEKQQKEISRLWTCIEGERLRSLETQSSFQTLQNLHSQAQGDLISMASEIQSKTQNLKEMETQTKALEKAFQKAEEEKKSLKELYLSSVISVNNLEVEISSLKEKTEKLEAEIELHLDQRHALQEEVYSMKKELADLNNKNRALLEQVESVGLNPECFGSSVKVLQNENSELREISEMDKNERTALLEKMKIMGELLDKNEILEISVLSLRAELEGVREKVEMLEDSCQSLLRDKCNLVKERANLTSQLQSVSENYVNLSEKNVFLENSLSDAIKELKEMTLRSNCLEESCFLLNRENSRMICEREKLESQLKITTKTVENQQKRYVELEENHLGLTRKREYALCEVEELQNLLDAAKREHASLNQLVQTKLSQVCQLLEEEDIRRMELEDEFEKAITANLEIFILQSCLRDAAKYNFSHKLTSERLLDGSKYSAMFISDLRQENIKRQVKTLRMGMDHRLETLEINEDRGYEDKRDLDQGNLLSIVMELKDTQHSLSKCCHENQRLVIEKMVIIELLRQLQSEAAKLVVKGDTLGEEFGNQSKQLSMLRSKNQKVLQLNEKLRSKLLESRQKEKDSKVEIENVSRKLLETQQMMRLILSERTELCRMMERLTNQCDEVKASQENQGKLIVKLSGVSDNQVKETGYLSELKTELDISLKTLVDEVDQYKSRVERLSEKLQKKRNEVDTLETQAAVSFEELQISAVREAFFKGKFFELIEAYEKLQTSKEKENVMLKEENGKLGFENDRLRSQLGSCILPLICLKESLMVLEERVAFSKKVEKPKTECVILASNLCAEKFLQNNDDGRGITVDISAELSEVQKRIHLVDLAVLEKMNANASLEMGMKEIEEINSRSSLHQENRQTIKHPSSQQEESKRGRLRRPKSEISEEGSEILMKDITLDQVSKSPSGRISRRQIIEADSHMLELWESTNKDGSIDLMVGNSKRLPTLSTGRYQNEVVKDLKGNHASINALIEKELDVNKLETSKRVSEARHERNRKKIVEKLDSDAQRLINLQITLQDLKKTMEMNEKTKKTKCFENDDAKRQLEEADAAILKLFDLNTKLKKSAEGRSMAMDGFADGSASVRNRLVLAQARRGSEKIGQLQSEVQRLQFLLLKMEDDKVNRSRIRVTERTQRVLLKDYLYGGKRTPGPRKLKKAPFCGCVQTPSRGEWSN